MERRFGILVEMRTSLRRMLIWQVDHDYTSHGKINETRSFHWCEDHLSPEIFLCLQRNRPDLCLYLCVWKDCLLRREYGTHRSPCRGFISKAEVPKLRVDYFAPARSGDKLNLSINV